MAEKIIQNPSITSGAFASMLAFSSDNNTITAISGHPIAGVGGGGTPVEGYWRPSVNADGDISWAWSLESTSTVPSTANIKGPQGIQGETGPQGPSGTNGKDGKDGKDGTNGYSVELQSVTDEDGGKKVTLSWGETPSTSSFVIPSGAKGADGQNGQNGANGFSPTVSTTTTASEDRTGTVLTFTYGDAGGQTVSYTAWDGKDGTGATVDLLEGTGIQITHAGTTYTIGVSADYFALKTDLPDVTDMATKTWVGQQGYLTSVPDSYATKTYANDASANALSQAQSWVQTEGYLKAVPAEYATKTYANDASAYALSKAETYADSTSAEALSQTKLWTNQQNFATSASLAADKLFAMTRTGWSDFTIPSTSGYLPTSGGTVTGQLTISGSDFNNILHLKRSNYEGFIGLSNNGAVTIKNVIPNSTSQIEFLTSANKTFDITVKDNSTTPQPMGKLYVMSAHSLADAAATSANWANDGMLHIILDS